MILWKVENSGGKKKFNIIEKKASVFLDLANRISIHTNINTFLNPLEEQTLEVSIIS